MDYIDRVMVEHLAMEPDELPPLSKHMKIPSPPTYEGSEVVKDFDDFAEGYTDGTILDPIEIRSHLPDLLLEVIRRVFQCMEATPERVGLVFGKEGEFVVG